MTLMLGRKISVMGDHAGVLSGMVSFCEKTLKFRAGKTSQND
jgi:hypothetical protein